MSNSSESAKQSDDGSASTEECSDGEIHVTVALPTVEQAKKQSEPDIVHVLDSGTEAPPSPPPSPTLPKNTFFALVKAY